MSSTTTRRGRGGSRGRGRARAVATPPKTSEQKAAEALAALSPDTRAALERQLQGAPQPQPNPNPPNQEMPQGANVNAASSVTVDRFRPLDAGGAGDANLAPSAIVDVVNKLHDHNPSRINDAAEKILKAAGVAAEEIGPGLSSDRYAALVRACENHFRDFSAQHRRAILARLVDGTIRGQTVADIEAMEVELFSAGSPNDKSAPVGRFFRRRLAKVLEVKLDVSAVTMTKTIPTFFANLVIVGMALDDASDCEPVITAIQKRLKATLNFDSTVAHQLDDAKSLATLSAWFKRYESSITKKGGDGGGKKKETKKSEAQPTAYVAASSTGDHERPVTIEACIAPPASDIGGEAVRALVDTGANRTLIDAELAKRLALPVKAGSTSLGSASKDVQISVVGTTPLSLRVGGFAVIEHDALVARNLRYPVIVGAPLLKRAKASIIAGQGGWSVSVESNDSLVD